MRAVEVPRRLLLLPLKVFQSVLDRQPACEPDAVWQPTEPPEPICVNEPVRGEEADMVDVPTEPSNDGYPALVQYES